jgi:hypothetical protein
LEKELEKQNQKITFDSTGKVPENTRIKYLKNKLPKIKGVS